MSARKASPAQARTRLTRRGVLTVGGLTLVTGYVLGPGKQTAATGRPPDARAATTHPASTHPASPRPAGPFPAGTEPGDVRRGADGSPAFYVDDGPKGIALTIDDGPSP